MGYEFSVDSFNSLLQELRKDHLVFAPVRVPGKGAFSETDLITYREITAFEQIELNEKSRFSPKEIVFPITQTLFYFTEDGYAEPKANEKGIIIFCRPCDVNAFKRLDEIFLNNGDSKDNYYEDLRNKVRFFVMECTESFSNCFCVSMGANKVDTYDAFVKVSGDKIQCDGNHHFSPVFARYGTQAEVELRFVTENTVKVTLTDDIEKSIFNHELWQEYSTRCIACGRCTVSCPTCTCFTMQDIFYEDNPNCGERRRVWASCMIDGFTDMAGGHGYRKDSGARMRFKAMHKIYDFRKRFGYNMCVGCGRCIDVCPEYISFTECINKVNSLAAEVNK